MAPTTLAPVSRPPMYLLVGPEELLLRRAAEGILDDLRAEHGDLDVVDIRAAELRDEGLPDLRTGSLFGTPRAVLIRDAQDLPAEVAAALHSQLEGAPPEALVVLLASSTGRIQKVAKAVKGTGGRIDVAPPQQWEEAKWTKLVADEFHRHGRTADKEAVEALLGHAGYEVSAVAEKVTQVAAAAPPGTVTAVHVETAVVGRGSRGSFAVADAMCGRRPAEALVLLRGVLEAGDDPVMVLGALAYRVRSIVAVASGLEGTDVGLRISAGQKGHLRRARSNFGPGELTRAYRILAEADREIKSGELPASFVLERAVVAVATRS
jgi:DNA polymerase III subunit delta